MHKSKIWSVLAGITLFSLVLAACAPATPQTIVQTQVVKETEVVEVVQTQVVKETQVVEVEKASYTTPHPILGDLKVRQAIAYCTNRPELIASVYPFLNEEQQQNLLMDTNIPRVSWAAYYGDEVQKYPFDLDQANALLDEAGWALNENTGFREKDGGELTLRFTTTSAAFRQTWAAVFEQQMAGCGIRIFRLHAPAAWWFGSTSGLRHRDFELGAYAWVGETDPKGQTLYACNQIPLPENGWNGQNYMGWCNETANDAILAANNTLDQAERQAQYKIFQIEFAKDMVSLPVFQRAEGNAATSNLEGFHPNPTEYYTFNADTWTLKDGGDTIVIASSQEPASMWTLIESSASQRYPAYLVFGVTTSQADYNYQAGLAELSTIESGLAVMNEVEVKEGDPVVDASGSPTDADGNLLTLTPGMMIKTSDGQEVEYTGGTVKMNQLVVTYKWMDGLTWSDGTPVTAADFDLGFKIDCDHASGAVSYLTCDSMQSYELPSDTEQVVTYKPGYVSPLYFLPWEAGYPAHQVLSDGRKLADVPVTEWSGLQEIAETPLGYGPYIMVSWEKGVKMEFVANPHYVKGEVAIKNITEVFIQDTQQAVAQLLTGDVDLIGSETLGAGAEVQTVLDAQAAGQPVQVLIEPSATWEHIDFNLFIP